MRGEPGYAGRVIAVPAIASISVSRGSDVSGHYRTRQPLCQGLTFAGDDQEDRVLLAFLIHRMRRFKAYIMKTVVFDDGL